MMQSTSELITAQILVAMARDGVADRLVVNIRPDDLGRILGSVLDGFIFATLRRVEALEGRLASCACSEEQTR